MTSQPQHEPTLARRVSAREHDAAPPRYRAAPSVSLTATQTRYLRGLCHHLKPTVRLGNKGVTTALVRELILTLDHHELVKVKLSGVDREQRQAQIAQLLEATGAELVHQVGHVASVFRRNPDAPKLALPG